jgi:hypothetical protein
MFPYSLCTGMESGSVFRDQSIYIYIYIYFIFFFATCNELVLFFFFQSLVFKYNEEFSLKLCYKINCCENKNKITLTKENTLKIVTKLKLKIK